MTYQSQFKSLTEMKKMHSRLCHTCKLVRPYRTSHCRHCNRCILAFDHHCPYIQNCVGYNNRIWFFRFVVSVLCCALCNVYWCYIILSVELYTYPMWFGVLLTAFFGFMGIGLTGQSVWRQSNYIYIYRLFFLILKLYFIVTCRFMELLWTWQQMKYWKERNTNIWLMRMAISRTYSTKGLFTI